MERAPPGSQRGTRGWSARSRRSRQATISSIIRICVILRILFLTHRLPYRPDRGDRIRAYHMLRILAQRSEVHVVSLVHDDAEAAHARDLHTLAASVTVARVSSARRKYSSALISLFTETPLTHALLDSPTLEPALTRIVGERQPNVVLAYCTGTARFALSPPLQSLPFVLDMVDVDSEKWRALGSTSRPPKSWVYRREARCLAAFETEAALRARVTLVVNQREQAALARLAPHANIRIIPNGVDVAFFRPPAGPSDQPHVVFCGVMNYEPNLQAGLWLIREIWPGVRAAIPQARLMLVGSDPPTVLMSAAARDPSITITGRVADVRPHLWSAAVSVAPMVTARGIQNKVLEATAAGLPSVVTSAVFAGLPSAVHSACRVAGDVGTFVAAIIDLLRQAPENRRARATSADMAALTWEQQLGSLGPIVEHACKRDGSRDQNCSSATSL
jgi:polysaccharide biosynthesis protein PslH